MNYDNPIINLTWKGECYVNPSVEGQDFLVETNGIIWAEYESEPPKKIGEFRLYFCDIEGAGNSNIDSYDVLDTTTHTFEYYKVLMSSGDYGFSKKVNKALNTILSNFNVLIIDRIEIAPQYRSNGYGLQVMLALMQRFGSNAGICAIKPFPLQFEGIMQKVGNAGSSETALKKATAKLVSYYKHLGFIKLPNTPFMVRSLQLLLPTQESIESTIAAR